MSQGQAKTKSGQPCPCHALPGSNFRFTHSPDHAQERIQARCLSDLDRRHHSNSRSFPAPDITVGNHPVRTAAGLITFTDALLLAAWYNNLPANRQRTLGALAEGQMKFLFRPPRPYLALAPTGALHLSGFRHAPIGALHPDLLTQIVLHPSEKTRCAPGSETMRQ